MNVCPGVAMARTRMCAPTSITSPSDRRLLELHRVGRVHVVRGARGPRQRQPAGHVVVVDVRLEHVGDAHAPLLRQGEHPVDVTLRIDHEGDLAVV